MKIFACQFAPSWEDKTANFDAVSGMLTGAAIPQDSLIVLPEMFATGFSMDSASLAETLEDSETLKFLAEQAQQYQSHILAGMDVETDGKKTNDAVLIAPDGSLTGRYSKIRPFSPSGECDAVSTGNTVVTMPVGDWTIAPFVCYDLRFPELFRLAVPSAELLVVIANWPSPRIEQMLTLLKARAIENQAYVVSVNRIGSDPNLNFCGRSVFINPQGEIIAEAGDVEEVLTTEINRSEVCDWRETFPALKDRVDPSTLSLQELR